VIRVARAGSWRAGSEADARRLEQPNQAERRSGLPNGRGCVGRRAQPRDACGVSRRSGKKRVATDEGDSDALRLAVVPSTQCRAVSASESCESAGEPSGEPRNGATVARDDGRDCGAVVHSTKCRAVSASESCESAGEPCGEPRNGATGRVADQIGEGGSVAGGSLTEGAFGVISQR